MKRDKKHKTKYSPEFKISVIMDMREHGLNYHETVRKYWGNCTRSKMDGYRKTLRRWERKYLTEGEECFMAEGRGRNSKGRPRKKSLPTEAENDLIAENKWLKERNLYLEAELEYLKKLDALVRAEEQRNGRKPK